MQLQCLPLLWAKKKDGSQYLTQKTGFNTLFTRVVLVKLGGKFHEKPSKGEEGLWRVAEMATKNAMFIGQPHTQRHLWRKRNGQKLDREVDSSKSLANSNTYLAHNRVQIFFEGSFLFFKKTDTYSMSHQYWANFSTSHTTTFTEEEKRPKIRQRSEISQS